MNTESRFNYYCLEKTFHYHSEQIIFFKLRHWLLFRYILFVLFTVIYFYLAKPKPVRYITVTK